MTLDEELARCRPWIEAALEYTGGTHDFSDIELGIRSGFMQLWPAPRGCGVTEIVVYPKKKVLHVFLAGGERGDGIDQLTDMIESAAAWGREQGCEDMTMAGRVGWERVLGKIGWRPAFRVMERAI